LQNALTVGPPPLRVAVLVKCRSVRRETFGKTLVLTPVYFSVDSFVMRLLRFHFVPVGIAVLWAVLLLTGGADQQAQTSFVGTDVVEPVTTVHTPTEAGAQEAPARPLPAVADVQPSGDADGEERGGFSTISSNSSARADVSGKQTDVSGRRVPGAQSCAVLCVFLC